MSELLIVADTEATAMDRGIAAWAEWCGVAVSWRDTPPLDLATRTGEARSRVIAVSADTLIRLGAADRLQGESSNPGVGGCGSMLVYGISDAPEHQSIAARYGAGLAVVRVPSAPSDAPIRYRFAAAARTWAGALAGQEVVDPQPASWNHRFGLTGCERAGGATILGIGDSAHLARFDASDGTAIFMWCAASTVLPSEGVPRDTDLSAYYSRVLPLLVFLQSAFGPACWHNHRHKARLIIDDCLLHPRFGFIEYEELVDSMRRANYASTVAYIPWNHRRARASTVDLFSREPERLGVCVHGCDHTGGEFATQDESSLAWRSGKALARMDRFAKATGLAVDRVMVFPRGQFSPGAMRSLREAGFLAAVNTETHPSAPADPGVVELGELLRPASTRFSGFPLLPRHYPRKAVDFAVSLFVGRAAMVVEHHEFVKQGYREWESFVRALNNLEPDLEWRGLADIARDCFLQRRRNDGAFDVWCFCRETLWRNHLDHPVRTHWVKHEPDQDVVCDVVHNGSSIPFEWRDGTLHFEFTVDAGSSAAVQIRDRPNKRAARYTPSLSYQAKVFARRCLSEVLMNVQTRPSKRPPRQQG